VSNIITDYEYRERICAFLRANGVDPGRVPVDAYASICDGQLTVDILADVGGYSARRTIAVPLVVPPVGDVENWLT
jgi:hypothetical protein